jgi:hypothetical protein
MIIVSSRPKKKTSERSTSLPSSAEAVCAGFEVRSRAISVASTAGLIDRY